MDVGGLVLRDVDIAIVEGRVLDGIEGVLPLALFKNHLIRLDATAKTLELSTYPTDVVSDASSILRNGLLFVNGSLNETHEGHFLLDTGSAYKAISTSLARRMNAATGLSRALSVQSGVARMDAAIMPGITRFRADAHDLQCRAPVAQTRTFVYSVEKLQPGGSLGAKWTPG